MYTYIYIHIITHTYIRGQERNRVRASGPVPLSQSHGTGRSADVGGNGASRHRILKSPLFGILQTKFTTRVLTFKNARLVRMLRTHGEYKEAEALCAKVLERKIKTEAEPSSIARTQRQLGGILDDLGLFWVSFGSLLPLYCGLFWVSFASIQLGGILDDLGIHKEKRHTIEAKET